jgi:hypothetical protein
MNKNEDKLKEIRDELRLVLTGRTGIIDSLLPPVIFLLVNSIWSVQSAIWVAVGLAVVITLVRIAKTQSYIAAVGGLVAVALAAGATIYLGRAQGFFIPTIVSGGITVLLCFVSLIIKRPIVAYTSFITRRWPLGWYWHPKVRPAYSEVTWFWLGFFGFRLLLQIILYQAESTVFQGLLQILTGWPATIVLLVFSYVYGTWRLKTLAGPSVDEFSANIQPPWDGQQRGF